MAKRKALRLAGIILAIAFCLILRRDIAEGFREGWRTVMKG